MRIRIKKLSLTSLFFAIGLILPYFTMNVKVLGKMLLPMHYPVFLCGLVCGSYYGLIIGLLLPLVRYILIGTPVIYPTALAMSIELATYGFVFGYLYDRSKNIGLISLYKSIILAMVVGRIIWGIVYYLLLRQIGEKFTTYMFFTSAFISGLPGIIIQLIIIPIIAISIHKTKLGK